MYELLVTANGLRIRSEGSTKGKVLGSFSQGTIVAARALVNGWYQLANADGWISGDYVQVIRQMDDEDPAAEDEEPDVPQTGSTLSDLIDNAQAAVDALRVWMEKHS